MGQSPSDDGCAGCAAVIVVVAILFVLAAAVGFGIRFALTFGV